MVSQQTQVQQPQSAPINPNDLAGLYMYLFMVAGINAQMGITNQQLADAKTTEILSQYETGVNQYNNSALVNGQGYNGQGGVTNPQMNYPGSSVGGVLAWYASAIQYWANQAAKAGGSGNTYNQDEANMSAAQALYQQASAKANASSSNADSMVQNSQTQSQQDSTNIQNLLQVIQAAMALQSFIASLLGR